MGCSEVSNGHTGLGDEQDDNGPKMLNDATSTVNANIPNWTTIFTDIIAPFSWDSGPSLPEHFDVCMEAALDCFNLLACRRYQKLTQCLHVSDRAYESTQSNTDYDKLYKIHPVLKFGMRQLC